MILTTYDTLAADIPTVEQVHFGLLVADEVQNAKNPASKRWTSLDRVRRDASIAVTGTPIENSLLDLTSVMALAAPRVVGDPQGLERRLRERPAAAADWLAPLMIRRRVEDVADDLPDKIEQTLWLAMKPEEEARYRAAVEATSHMNPLQAVQYLVAASLHTDLIDTTGPFARTVIENSSKVETLFDRLQEVDISRGRAIVFCNRLDLCDSIAQRLSSSYAREVYQIDGRTPADERQLTVDRFNASRIGSVLVANPRAAGTGLNIQGANYVFHMSLEWNPAIMRQAEARAHRRGQGRTVFVYRLAYPGTADELVVRKLEGKQLLFDEVVEVNAGEVDASITDLRELWANRHSVGPEQ